MTLSFRNHRDKRSRVQCNHTVLQTTLVSVEGFFVRLLLCYQDENPKAVSLHDNDKVRLLHGAVEDSWKRLGECCNWQASFCWHLISVLASRWSSELCADLRTSRQ